MLQVLENPPGHQRKKQALVNSDFLNDAHYLWRVLLNWRL